MLVPRIRRESFITGASRGFGKEWAQAALKLATNIFGGRIDLSALKG